MTLTSTSFGLPPFHPKLNYNSSLPIKAFSLIQQRGLHPQLQRLNNECSNLLKEFMTDNDVAYQLKPKGKHSHNYPEKAIQTYKDQFLSGMSSTYPDFPLSQCCKLVEEVNIPLKLFRPSRLNTKLSAYYQVFGTFGYKKLHCHHPA